MASMAYGRRLFAALPPMARLADEADAIAWLREIAGAAIEG
jgi:ATP-dependent DNA helicase DinG